MITLKHMLLSALVAGTITLFGPHDMQEASALVVRAGVALIKLGVALYPQLRSYDAGPKDEDDPDNKVNDAGRAAGAHLWLAQFQHEWGVPFHPGCEMLGCEPIPGGRRCHWRCPHERPAPEPEFAQPEYLPAPQYTEPPYEPAPRYETTPASSPAFDPGPVFLLLACVGLAALCVGAAFASTSEAGVEKDIKETHALTEKLEADAREADARIAAFLQKMGGNGDGHG